MVQTWNPARALRRALYAQLGWAPHADAEAKKMRGDSPPEATSLQMIGSLPRLA